MIRNLSLIALFVAVCLKTYGQSAAAVSYFIPGKFIIHVSIPHIKPLGIAGKLYKINPDLHDQTGLDFDTLKGVISGTPTKTHATTDYTVTVVMGGLDSVKTESFGITIDSIGHYFPPVGSFFVDSLIANPMKPEIADSTISYEIDPNGPRLPKGLKLNARTGEIGGASFKTSQIQTYKINGVDNSDPKKIRKYSAKIAINDYPDFISTPATISFVGQGDIQQSLNTKSKIAANTGIGIVFKENSGRRYGPLHNIEIDFSINVASTADTVRATVNKDNNVTNREDFGNSVLLPLNSGQAFSFNFKGFLSERGGKDGNYRRNAAPISIAGVLSGFDVRFSGSNRTWEFTDKDTLKRTKVSVISFYIGPFFEFITPKKSNNYGQNASITLGFGFSGRWILGDIRQDNQQLFRNKLLGPAAVNAYVGPELTLGLKFYDIKAEVHLPFLSNKHSTPGLSGTHLTTFIGFRGGFPLDLKKTDDYK